LFQPGEQTAEGFEGYLFNVTITGVYAQEFGGAGLILERESLLISWFLQSHV
jgi:hypothetical protein